MRSSPFRLVGCVAVLSACGGGGTTIVNPPPPPPTGFRVQLTPHSEDAAVAAALGWASGIPTAEVTLTPTDSSAATRTVTSSAAGEANFGEIPPKAYILEVRRWLNTTEAARVPAIEGVDGWVVRERIAVAAGTSVQTISVPASRRRSLVISEWAFNLEEIPGVASYDLGGFLELYNNADTTVYLDGLVIAEGFNVGNDYPASSCTSLAHFNNDPLGVWTRIFARFPGTGRQQPVLPGQAVVVATDAIDHRQIFPEGTDLSHAGYEFRGSSDVDNPTAIDVEDIGIVKHSEGHGLIFFGLDQVVILSLPLDVPSLVRLPTTNGASEYARIPKERVLDVLWARSNYAGNEYPECPRVVNAAFDRAGSRARGIDETTEGDFSLSRRVAPLLPSGARVLQHSRSGFADFIRTPKTPGALP
jgi:hypothetical protein